jgi:glycosyltransferase involved in cell wall biosynthesis
LSADASLRFSVVVPTLDRRTELEGCLEAIAAMDYARDSFEVVVVDDGGREDLGGLVADWRDRLDIDLLQQRNAGPAAARNLGATAARGRYLAFTDDDCRPAPGWLAAFDAVLNETPEDALGGTTDNALDDNPFSSASQLIAEFLHRRLNEDKARFFASNNLCVPANEFRALGGFNPSYRTGEDREFCRRWRAAGHGLRLAPAALVSHANDLGLLSFCRQHYGYGRGSCRFHRTRLDHHSQGFQASRFYLDLLLYPLERSKGAHAVLTAALVALAQLATAAGFLVESVLEYRSAEDEESAGT